MPLRVFLKSPAPDIRFPPTPGGIGNIANPYENCRRLCIALEQLSRHFDPRGLKALGKFGVLLAVKLLPGGAVFTRIGA